MQCADGSKPDGSSISCAQCGTGTAGVTGSCGQCPAGQEASADRTSCVDCSSGRAGVGGECSQCDDGSEPVSSLQSCTVCPAGSAGTGGTCGLDCGVGTAPNAARTLCQECGVGEASAVGESCAVCGAGFEPDAARGSCVECATGAAGIGGVCAQCGAGFEPNAGRTSCSTCSTGTAGVGGVCVQCADGREPDGSSISCVSCGTGRAGVGGVCNTDCAAGTEPSVNRTSCLSCVEGSYSMLGEVCEVCIVPNVIENLRACRTCGAGQGPNSERTSCDSCAAGRFSGLGFGCQECAAPNTVNAARTACIPPYQCPPGSSCPSTIDCTIRDNCTSCPAGEVSLGLEQCSLCDQRGKVANEGQSACESCGAGTEPSSSRTACNGCELGRFSSFGFSCEDCASPRVVQNVASQCNSCPAGHGPNHAVTGCVPCSGTNFSTIGVCQECLAPNSVNEDHTGCAPPFVCPPGSQCTTDCSINDCTRCPAGNVSLGREQCEPCDQLGKVANAGQSACESCGVGEAPDSTRTACDTCNAGMYSSFGIACVACVYPQVVTVPDGTELRTGCGLCSAGTGPSANMTACVPCDGLNYSISGVCQPCVAGTAPREDRTGCDELGQDSQLTSVAAVTDILDKAENIQPAVSLPFVVDAAVLEDGSPAQAEFLEAAAVDMAAALGVPREEIQMLGIESDATGRRRLQDTDVTIQFVITSVNASAAVAGIKEQLADPTSALRTSPSLQGIPSTAAVLFSFSCPKGMLVTANDCAKCPKDDDALKEEYDEEKDRTVLMCRKCEGELGLIPNDVGDDCVCGKTTAGTHYAPALSGGLACFSHGWKATDDVTRQCQSCGGMECLSNCFNPGVAEIKAGYAPVWEGVLPARKVSVFKCSPSSACPGGPGALEPLAPHGWTDAGHVGTHCSPGYEGRICGSCEDTHARTGDGCVTCENITGLGMVVRVFVALILGGIGYLIMTALSGRVEVTSQVLKEGARPHSALLPRLSTRTHSTLCSFYARSVRGTEFN